ncbi:hypothetical protein [Mycolicibacterium tusciae]|uniref:hypothetical protein n=1 Tax=Mycolicibacterium tusciae TaxID=75922 RepID=UPI00024A4282|nr:hypothetical protein [Mycolicibacterium tusciae]
MRIQSTSLTTLLALAAAAVAIIAAPTAMAASTIAAKPGQVLTACDSTGPGTECITPGNAQINDSLPVDNFYSYGSYGYPYGGYGLALGGIGGIGGMHGGMHGGGHNGGHGGR